MKTTRLFSVPVMAALLAGCSADQGRSDNAPPAGATPSTTTTAETPAATPSTTPPPAYDLLGQDELTAALLTIKDMPPGFAEEKSTASRNKTFCDYKPPAEEKLRATRTFVKGGGLGAEVLSVNLRQYA